MRRWKRNAREVGHCERNLVLVVRITALFEHLVLSGVLDGALNRVLVVVDANRARAEPRGRDGEDAGPGAEVEDYPAVDVERLQCGETQPRRCVMARSEAH